MYESESEAEEELTVATQEDRRRESRYPSSEAAVVSDLNTGSMFEAETVNVSKSGIRLRAPQDAAPGTRVRARLGQVIVFGEVRWCRAVEGGLFDLGVRVDHTVAQRLVADVHRAANRLKKDNAD